MNGTSVFILSGFCLILGITWTIQDAAAWLSSITVIVLGLSFCIRAAWKQGKATGETNKDMERLKKGLATALVEIEKMRVHHGGERAPNGDVENKLRRILGEAALHGVDLPEPHEGDS